jgi:tetratricopeptide (TPR) repeat protein
MTSNHPKRISSRSLVFLLGVSFLSTLSLQGQSSPGPRTLRMELEGAGCLLVTPPQTSTDGQTSQLLLEKPGGTKRLLAESQALDFVGLLKGDLDGDQISEVVAIAQNRSSDDQLPYIFKGHHDLKQVFPPREEDNPLLGKEISIVSGKTGSLLRVKTLLSYYDFGPPDLFLNEFYKLSGEKLVKTGENIVPGEHFNQKLNYAGFQFHRGKFFESFTEYQNLLASPPTAMPASARAEALFAQGECLKLLKDFNQALALFDRFSLEYPQHAKCEIARSEAAFLKKFKDDGSALSLFTDVTRLERQGKSTEALALLEKGFGNIGTNSMGDHLLFLRGELLADLDRVEEALHCFSRISQEFPQSLLKEKAETMLMDLQLDPDLLE